MGFPSLLSSLKPKAEGTTQASGRQRMYTPSGAAAGKAGRRSGAGNGRRRGQQRRRWPEEERSSSERTPPGGSNFPGSPKKRRKRREKRKGKREERMDANPTFFSSHLHVGPNCWVGCYVNKTPIYTAMGSILHGFEHLRGRYFWYWQLGMLYRLSVGTVGELVPRNYTPRHLAHEFFFLIKLSRKQHVSMSGLN